MRKIIALFTVICIFTCMFSGCGKEELVVFAAASMTETLTKLGDKYMSEHEGVKIVFNFDSSGTLKTQIEEGAEVDVFISAGQLQMDQLDVDGSNCILGGSRIDVLENKVVLAVPESNPKAIYSFSDMVAGLNEGTVMLAMGNLDVPVGQYTQKIFKFYDLKETEIAESGNITYGSNVKEVTTQIAESMVDCGIVYQTDAFSAGLTIVDTASEEMCGRVIYPGAVMNVSKKPELARDFLAYLFSAEGEEIFEEAGFTLIN